MKETWGDLMRNVRNQVGKLKAEAAAASAAERRARIAWDACRDEAARLRRYAERSAKAGNEADARRFLERSQAHSDKEAPLKAAYESVSAKRATLERHVGKLTADLDRLEARYAKLNMMQVEADAQRRWNAEGADAFKALEEEANRAYDEATALAELREER